MAAPLRPHHPARTAAPSVTRYNAIMIDLCDQDVVVMGLGRFGGGVGVTKYLARHGARVLVTDQLTEEDLRDSLRQLRGLPVRYRLGGHDPADFTHAHLIVVNPAVDTRNNPYLLAARNAGARLTSEIQLLIDQLDRRRVIGVTGTAGKSTTTAMIGHILDRVRDTDDPAAVWVGGNLGGSLLNDLPRIGPRDHIVLELSSFMLETLDDWSPHVAVVTNIAENHLDRHDTFDAYVRAKQTILRHQTHDDRAILGPGVDDWRHITPAICVIEDEPMDLELPVPGEHNRMNATLAVAACEAVGVDRRRAVAALADFPGLPHRMQVVAERAGVRFINDSKSTTPRAATRAIDSFPTGSVRLILGGFDKRAHLNDLAHHAAEHCPAIYTIGDTGERIADAAEALIGLEGHHCHVYRCGDLDTAVMMARAHAEPGQVVLLSPGCASWDQFEHFQQRGERFVQLSQQPAPAANPATGSPHAGHPATDRSL